MLQQPLAYLVQLALITERQQLTAFVTQEDSIHWRLVHLDIVLSAIADLIDERTDAPLQRQIGNLWLRILPHPEKPSPVTD